MRTKNEELKLFRKTEMRMHKLGENRERGHIPYIHLFFIMSLAVICFMLLFASTGVVSATITGDSPNPSGDTIIDEDTVWDGENDIYCGGDIIVGDPAKRIYFDIKNSHVTVKGKWTMGGDTPVNFTLLNSTIFFDVTSGESTWQPVDAVINTTQRIIVAGTYDQSKASRIELRNSTIRGTNSSYLAAGVTVESGAYGNARHTVIADNVTFAYLGGVPSESPKDYYALNLHYASIESPLSNDSSLTNLTFDYCGRGLHLCENIGVDYITANGGILAFVSGKDWNHLTMHKTVEGLYNPADGAWIRNSWFDAGETKFNIMSASNVLFENNTVLLAAFNAGAGQWPHQGNNNTIRNNTFIQTGVGGVKDGLKIIGNTFDRGMPTGGNTPISAAGINFLIKDNVIKGGNIAIKVFPATGAGTALPEGGKGSGHIIENNIIDSGVENPHAGIFIGQQDNVTIINNSISNITSIYSYDGYGIKICENSSNILLRDNSITNTARYDIAFGGWEQDLDDSTKPPSSNIKFINTKFDENKVHFANTIDVFNNYYYLDVKVVDSSGNPIQGATVTITNDVDSNYPSINVNGETKTSFVTGADGHTPLPSDAENSIAILDYWQTKTEKREMSYTITASKDGYSNSTTVTPDSSWYRSDPNTYQNTVTIVLPITIETGTLTGIVTDKDTGLPIQGALIKASSHQTTTNSTGDYILSLPVGNYTLTASKAGYQSATSSATVNEGATTTVNFTLTPIPADTTPPASIYNLENRSGATWINWTWTNPSDDDFAYTMVYLNGVFKTNTSSPYYNATNLTANTTYEIGTHTVDVNGNVNDTWVNQTARTIASKNGSVSGTITYTHNETGIAEVTVNLTQNGTSINSTVTDSSGNYTFTNISPGDYNITASKIRFWSNSTSPVTVNAGASTTANLMLWLKGDLNNDGKVSEIDLALMRSAVAEYELPIPVDWKFDINSDGKVNEVDIAIIRNMIA